MHLSPPPLTDAPVLVGYSGGLDSTALLHRLAGDDAQRRRGLRALHVHHGLHPDADAWAAHCQAQCDALGITLGTIRVQVDRSSGMGLEAAAREARHAAFAASLRDGELLALAHHRDDQAETFLLRAMRGSGTRGLAAMRPFRPFARGWLWRPLLETPRRHVHDYARRFGLHWIDDPSNADTLLDRNFLRHQVLPLLTRRWPGADAALARCAALAGEAETLLVEGDALALARARTLDPQVLSMRPLQALPAMRRARVLQRWVGALRLPPLPANGITRVEAMLAADDGTMPVFDWSGARIQYWRGMLRAGAPITPLPEDFEAEWDGATPLALPGGGRIALLVAERFPAPLRVHARRGGERIRLPGRSHRHALKHVLQDLGVPAWERPRLPLLSDADGQLLAAGDLVHAHDFDAWLRQHGARLWWQPEPPPTPNPAAGSNAAGV
ncbi:MAG: tRNA lysidine(34) synthetase TilS [Pseudoxanthomonas suwonensis]|nr:tRNA lysidine(34) synthetase TilS [Pseudoxanthomonas suwonensis]